MIKKMLEKLEELRSVDICAGITCAECEKICGEGDCSKNYQFLTINKCKEIVQEAAKEYGKDTNIRNNGWIPVETELPKEHLWAGHMISEEVFVTFLDNNEKVRVDTDNTYDGKWHYYGDRVIAWMPKKLPAPYQKGE